LVDILFACLVLGYGTVRFNKKKKQGQPFVKINGFTDNSSTSIKLFAHKVSVQRLLARATFCGWGVTVSNLQLQG
jgi:hypothetical protein